MTNIRLVIPKNKLNTILVGKGTKHKKCWVTLSADGKWIYHADSQLGAYRVALSWANRLLSVVK